MPDLTNFKKSAKWYDANRDALLAKYRGKYVGICINRFCGAWDDQNEGVNAMIAAGYTLGDFLVHRCVPLEEEPFVICHTDDPTRNPMPLFLPGELPTSSYRSDPIPYTKGPVIMHAAEEGGYWGEVPAMPGCVSEGDTEEECRANVIEAAEGCIEAYRSMATTLN